MRYVSNQTVRLTKRKVLTAPPCLGYALSDWSSRTLESKRDHSPNGFVLQDRHLKIQDRHRVGDIHWSENLSS
jgi:hypothetical protein